MGAAITSYFLPRSKADRDFEQMDSNKSEGKLRAGYQVMPPAERDKASKIEATNSGIENRREKLHLDPLGFLKSPPLLIPTCSLRQPECD